MQYLRLFKNAIWIQQTTTYKASPLAFAANLNSWKRWESSHRSWFVSFIRVIRLVAGGRVDKSIKQFPKKKIPSKQKIKKNTQKCCQCKIYG